MADWGRLLYLQIFRISFAGRVRWGALGAGAFAEVAKTGAVVGRRGGLIRLRSAIMARNSEFVFYTGGWNTYACLIGIFPIVGLSLCCLIFIRD